MSTSFEDHVKLIAADLREKFKSVDANHIGFELGISGRPDGDLIIEYRLSDSWMFSDAVKGDSIEACVEELWRRRKWARAHNPVCLPNYYIAPPKEGPQYEDEIPF